MSKITGGPAFPYVDADADVVRTAQGMTLRDYFAAAVIGGFSVAHEEDANPASWRWDELTETAYRAADEMLKARAK